MNSSESRIKFNVCANFPLEVKIEEQFECTLSIVWLKAVYAFRSCFIADRK
jgi:hypothetical protein